MRQRAALARALAQDAEVLLMDEPFGALDAMTRDVLHDELETLWRDTGMTVLFVTHNVREAVRLGDRVVLLSSRPGRVARDHPGDHRAAAPHRLDRRSRRSRRRSPTGCATEVRRHGTWSVTRSKHRALADADSRRAEVRRAARASGPRPGRSCSRSRIFVGVWQVVVWTGWKPEYVLPSPFTVFDDVLRPSAPTLSAAPR